MFPGCLRLVAESYIENNKPDIIHTNVAYLDSNGQITRLIRVPRQSRFFFYRGAWHVVAPTLFYKSSLFRAVGGVDRKYHLSMDLYLWMRMMKAGARVAHVPYYLGGFRWHKSSKTVMSLSTRRTREGWEESDIFKTNLPSSNRAKRRLWRWASRGYILLRKH